MAKKILIIDDDPDVVLAIRMPLESAGYEVRDAHSQESGLVAVEDFRPDLIILDVMMPGIDGFQICQRIRQYSNTPLIMLTALDHDEHMLKGLEVGADDFLSKPINREILLARAKAVLRRGSQSNSHPDLFHYDDGRLEIDFEKHRVLVEGKEVKLTPVEFRLLSYLATNAGKVLSYEQILFSVWGSEYKGNDDYVHVYISHLRSKIEQDPKKPSYIVSIHGVGYIFEKQNFVGSLSGQ
jgi:DNA-binding response OmpR family regulator